MQHPRIMAVVLSVLLFLTGCTAEQKERVCLDPNAPVLTFTPVTHTQDGKPMYYLFDDNPEHLNPNYLADHPQNPSSIAHFENLTPGVYTVFSYHHRGSAVDFNADLYYDAAFTADSGGKFQILAIGIDHNWDWNQAWADYTNTPVYMPEFLRTYDCVCADGCTCKSQDGNCPNPDCPCTVRDTYRYPKTQNFDHLQTEKTVAAGGSVLLSEWISYITEGDLHHFRYGGYDEPMWMMLKFAVLEGEITFDTLAYQNKASARQNLYTMRPGAFANEPQYKGIAPNAPIVETSLFYPINDSTPAGGLPITIKNMRVPDGYTQTEGKFATNVNTWREETPIAAESDLMRLTYPDDTKRALYGKDVQNPDNIWRFDAYHTKAYQDTDKKTRKKYKKYGIQTGDAFQPNGEMRDTTYPTGAEPSTDEFYTYTACNLGNFGVTYRYTFTIQNTGTKARDFVFDMRSIAGQVYRFRQQSANGRLVKDDGGYYLMKKFDDNPAVDPSSDADPPRRLAPAEYTTSLSFSIPAGETNTITLSITTLTGCTAPMHNTLRII